MNQGIRNANDGISLAQTAEGALDEVSNMLQRMRELQVQAGNGTYSTSDLANIGAEQEALAQQIQSVVQNTSFNGKNLFSTADNDITIQAGANASDTVTIELPELDVAYGAGPPAVGQLSQIVDFTADPADATEAKLATGLTLAKFDSALASVATTRANLGAAQNRLESAVNNLTSNATNLSDARSRIEDADFSTETTNLAKAQILSQASTAMLAQANQSQQGVLKLLG
jgi:flagellin